MKKLALLFLVALLCKSVQAQYALNTAELDAYIIQGMADFDIPGLSIGIIKDGKTVFLKGFGTREYGKQEPVDSNTLFMIASNSKLFTGTILAHLAQKKRLSLDDKIIKYYPDFRLYDSLTTLQVTVRDMLTHRIGTKTFQGDFTFLDSKLTRLQIMERMRYLKPVGIYRQDYGYCNSCFLTAGMVAEKATGQTWEALVTDSILKPLGMQRTQALSNNMPTLANISYPYTTIYTGKVAQMPHDIWDNLGPAASIISTAADMTHWLRFQLDSGRYQGKRVLPWASVAAPRDMQIATSSRKSARYPVHFRGYGLGLAMADYNGRAVYNHTGGAVGMVSGVCFVPEEKLGIVILTNQDNQSFFEALRYHILDLYTGTTPVPDRTSDLKKFYKEDLKTQQDSMAKWQALTQAAAAKKTPIPSFKTGIYTNLVYGKVQLVAIPKTNQYQVSYTHHPFLKTKLTWLGADKWLAEHSPIEYGIFPAKVGSSATGKQTITLQYNDFIEIDPYTFEQE